MAEDESARRYDDWYRTPRGRWIGDVEFRLLIRMLHPRPGETLLDVGCGTGYFTRRLARHGGMEATGLDPNHSWLDFARRHAAGEAYVAGRAEALPFPACGFDCTVSVTALCFIADQKHALREMIRVTRRRFAVGLLNRCSVLYLEKGRRDGSGAYRGARWHTPEEVRSLLDGLPVRDVELQSAVFLPNGGILARALETSLPGRWLGGGLPLAAGSAV